jgi:hypothetical protein
MWAEICNQCPQQFVHKHAEVQIKTSSLTVQECTYFTEAFEIVHHVRVKALMDAHDIIQWNALPFIGGFVECFIVSKHNGRTMTLV